MHHFADVAIVGGGPGGLFAAERLARRGVDVVLFEEHASAGEPVHCTGVLAAEAFDELDLPRDSILNPLNTARFFSPSGTSFDYTPSRTEAVVIDRLAFDQALGRRAAQAGARVQADSRVVDVRVDDEAVTIEAAGGVVAAARACILACGANYTIQRRLGLGMASLYLQSAQIELPARRLGETELHFGSSVAPKGFAWVVPVSRDEGTFARVGLMCERDARDHFDRFLARVTARWQIEADARAAWGLAPRSKVLPLGPIEKTFAPRLLAVGDAAGLVKPTTGGGIYYSLVSGALAADVLGDALQRGDLGEAALGVYEERWRARLGDEIDAQAMLREIANRLSDPEIDSLFDLARTNGIMPIVRRTAAFNRHRDLILSLLAHPPARRVLLGRMLG